MLPEEAQLEALRDQVVGGFLTGSRGVRYYLRDLLGEGGQGWVYKANYDERDGMWVVVKLLRPDSVNPEALRRFQREAEVLRMMGMQPTPCPHVVRFYDHGITRFHVGEGASARVLDLPFTVLEYVDGITLADVIDGSPGKGLSVGRVRRILRQVVRALETVHAHRIVHRDLKPSNILLMSQSRQEVVKVTDFGLVKLVDLKMNQTTAFAGATLGYAPPEQYEHGNERVSEQSDVFSLAAILFECLAGRAAFPYADGDPPLRVITQIIMGARPSLADCANNLSLELQGQDDLIQRLDRAITQGLQPDPSNRQPTCRAFWSEVEPVMHGGERRTVKLSGIGFNRAEVSGVLDRRQSHPDNSSLTDAPTRLGHGPRLIVLSDALSQLGLRSALFGGDGTVLAVGPEGLYRWSQRSWSVLPTPPGLFMPDVRAMIRTPDGCSLLMGDHGMVVTLFPDGRPVWWPLRQPDLRVFGAWMDRPDEAFLVGENTAGGGFFLHLSRQRESEIQRIDTPTVLRAIQRTAGGKLIVCGDGGALFLWQSSILEPMAWERTGHLRAMAARPNDGLAIVGSGGHALHISPSMRVWIEPVQTTRDLTAVTMGFDGALWAVGEEGRVLRHDGTTWVRVSPSTPIPARLIGVGATSSGVLVLGDDGLVVGVQ